VNLETTEIKRQPDPERDCAFYALINLHISLGLEPPTMERMREISRTSYLTAPHHLGLTIFQQMYILGALEFPLPMAVGAVPRVMEAQDFFPGLMDAGCLLVFSFLFRVDGQRYGHSVVAESYSDDGITALCSGADFYRVVEWDRPKFELYFDGAPHGSRILVPWRTIPYDLWANIIESPKSIGIQRECLIVWPPPAVKHGSVSYQGVGSREQLTATK
jgi:hypothetical protein